MVIFVHRRHIILYHIHAFLKLTKQLPVQTAKWTRMLPCFLGSLQLPDGDCKVSWELPRFRMDAPSEGLWSFEEHFWCFYFQRLNAFMPTLAKSKAQNLDSVAVLCLPTCPDNGNSICKRSSPSCPDKHKTVVHQLAMHFPMGQGCCWST